MNLHNKRVRLDFSVADAEVLLEKIRYFCSYRERSEKETVQKLKSMKLPFPKITSIIKQLKNEGFIDDERFARAFVRGKWRVNHWGRTRIAYELRAKGMPEKIIKPALEEIEKEDYRQGLIEIVRKYVTKDVRKYVRKDVGKGAKNMGKVVVKRSEVENISGEKFHLKDKIFNFALGKGYEPDLILEILHELKL